MSTIAGLFSAANLLRPSSSLLRPSSSDQDPAHERPRTRLSVRGPGIVVSQCLCSGTQSPVAALKIRVPEPSDVAARTDRFRWLDNEPPGRASEPHGPGNPRLRKPTAQETHGPGNGWRAVACEPPLAWPLRRGLLGEFSCPKQPVHEASQRRDRSGTVERETCGDRSTLK